jgi:hypothetical protein
MLRLALIRASRTGATLSMTGSRVWARSGNICKAEGWMKFEAENNYNKGLRLTSLGLYVGLPAATPSNRRLARKSAVGQR